MTAQIRWHIFLADLNPVEGSEQGGQRPVLVISNEDFNLVMPVVTVLPITSLKPGRRLYPGEVLLKKGEANLDADSVVLAHQIRTISRKRLRKAIGSLDKNETHQNIEAAIKLHLGLP